MYGFKKGCTSKYPLANKHNYGTSPCLIGKTANKMAMLTRGYSTKMYPAIPQASAP